MHYPTPKSDAWVARNHFFLPFLGPTNDLSAGRKTLFCAALLISITVYTGALAMKSRESYGWDGCGLGCYGRIYLMQRPLLPQAPPQYLPPSFCPCCVRPPHTT